MKSMIAACLVSLSGLAFSQAAPQTVPTTPTTETTAPSQALTDAQITTILQTANKAEVEAGKKAQKTAKNKEVVEFAKQMVTDHGKAEKDVKALTHKLKWKDQDSDINAQLKAAAKDSESKLKSKKGTDFAKTYVDEQVTMHQTVLNSIDTQLIPNAKNDEVKSLLTNVRSTVSAHLDHAKQLQSAAASM